MAASSIFLTLPWYKSVSPLTAYCVAKLVERNRCQTCLHFGDAFVAHSRNICADRFLSSNCEWQLTIDDDMVVPFGHAAWYNSVLGLKMPDKFAGLNVVERFLASGKTLIGGLYFSRTWKNTPMYAEGANIPAEREYCRKAPIDQVKATRWVGTGCMMIHRSVYEDIEKRFPRLSRGRTELGVGQWFSSSEHSAMDHIDRVRNFLSGQEMSGEKCLRAFQMLETASAEARANSSLGMGEDVQFCTRAAASGHVPHVDLGVVLGHVGTNVFGPGSLKDPTA